MCANDLTAENLFMKVAMTKLNTAIWDGNFYVTFQAV